MLGPLAVLVTFFSETEALVTGGVSKSSAYEHHKELSVEASNQDECYGP